ncbi:hypothetical protein EV121DRAFT_274750, partial [Schizophyllum commune]
AKGALSFAVNTSIQHLQPDGRPVDSDAGKSPKAIPTLITQLVIGCRRRVVIYSWRDGDAQDTKSTRAHRAQELVLPHSPRAMAFLNPDVVCFGYSPTEYATFTIPTMSVTDISTPPPPQPSTTVGAFTGLSGYMALALGARQKPEVLQVAESEGLITKDTEGIFVGPQGKVTRPSTIQWPTAPEDIAYVKPYIFCAFPAGTVPDRASPPNTTQQLHQTSVIQLYSALSMQAVQIVPYPFTSPDSSSTATLASTSTSPTKASSTTTTTAAANEGSTTAAANEGSTTAAADGGRTIAAANAGSTTAPANEGSTTAPSFASYFFNNGQWLHTPLSASASTPATSPLQPALAPSSAAYKPAPITAPSSAAPSPPSTPSSPPPSPAPPALSSSWFIIESTLCIM